LRRFVFARASVFGRAGPAQSAVAVKLSSARKLRLEITFMVFPFSGSESNLVWLAFFDLAPMISSELTAFKQHLQE